MKTQVVSKRLKPSILKTFSSKYNGEIELVNGTGGYSLLVNGVTQSGPDMETIWDEVFEKLLSPEEKVQNVLILGFGAGSIVKPIRKRWPNSLITGVEIDPVMIEIAKEYFPENLDRVDTVIFDAVKYVDEKQTMKRPYDLIIVDCYIGDAIPEKMNTIKFLVNIRKIGKIVLLNQLFLPNKKSELAKIAFLKQLDRLYPVQALKLPYNIVIQY